MIHCYIDGLIASLNDSLEFDQSDKFKEIVSELLREINIWHERVDERLEEIENTISLLQSQLKK